MTNYFDEAKSLWGEIKRIRETLHAFPELSGRENDTAVFIEKELRSLGITACRCAGTGVIGDLETGKPGRTVALRADMDALPIREQTGASFSSEHDGVMHACGHDVHMAAALGAARILANHVGDLHGRVRFIFQPDEEVHGGAEKMIEAGCLNNVDAIFGLHVSPDLPEGYVGIRYGCLYAASNPFHVEVIGKSAHGAEREKGVDALLAAAKMVVSLIDIPKEYVQGCCVVSVGQLNSGTAKNIIPDRAEFHGITRSLGSDVREAVCKRVSEIIEGVASDCGAKSICDIVESYPGVANDDEAMVNLVSSSATALFGSGRVVNIDKPTMMTEDFGYYLQKCPGCFYHIGAGCSRPLHSSTFLPSDGALIAAAALHAQVLSDFIMGWSNS